MNHIDKLSSFKVTEVELIYRNKVPASQRPLIQCSSDAYKILIKNWDLNRIELLEQFKIVLLDRRNACIGISEISTGGMTECIADPRIVFSTALKARAAYIILSHNHPSGNMKPSKQDFALTERMITGGRIVGVEVIEHMIVAPETYYSFADEGIIPSCKWI